MKRVIKSNEDSWEEFKEQLDVDLEEYSDPIYEMTDAGETISECLMQAESNLGVWGEPSVQAGVGGIWYYSSEDDSLLAEDIDFEDFDSNLVDLAFNSNSASDLTRKIENYLQNLLF